MPRHANTTSFKKGRCGGPNNLNYKHGKARTPEYNAWVLINQRCYNPNDPAFPNYGGRGIKVCRRWRSSSAQFLTDMGPKPSPQHTIERVDNNGPYAPWNCRWATRQEQNNNRRVARSCRLITCGDETLTLVQWANRTGLKRCTISNRLNHGWDVARALTTPVN